LFSHEQPGFNELRLEIGAFQKDRAGAFHFVQRAIDVARFEFNAAAAIQDDKRI
jgi:hypothetical protein